MKKNWMIMAVALIFAGCNSDDILENIPEQVPEQQPAGVIQVPIHITTDNASGASSKARKVAGTDTGSELTFVWESSDGIDVFAGETGLTRTMFTSPSSGVGTRSAEFDGTLNYNASENGDLALNDNTPLYSYIRNANLTYNADDRIVTMNLAEQTGTLNDALAHTLFWAESTYNGGDVHFTYQNQMAVMKFNITNVGTESGTGTVTFMADEGMPNAVTCSAKTGAVTPGTGMYVKATAASFSNGEATVYLAIVPNAASAITKAEVRIDINGNTYFQQFKNQNIPAGTIEGGLLYPQNIKKAKRLKVGDVLYKDGTWGTKEETAANKTKNDILGIVGDINPTQEDVEAGYRHGYAIYYEDLPNDKEYDWASEHLHHAVALYVQYVHNAYDVTYPTLDITPRGASLAVVIDFLNQESSGLGLSRTLYPLRVEAAGVDHISYPAAYYAYDEWGEKGEAAGTHSFLPTAGEMFRVLTNLGILDINQSFTSSGSGFASQTETFAWANQNYEAEMNLALTVACTDGAKALNLNVVASGLGYYWTTSEDDASESFAYYLKDGSITFNAQQKTDKKLIRPLVAF